MTTTGRSQWARYPAIQQLPFKTPEAAMLLNAWRQQSRMAEMWAQAAHDLNLREDECWRMFGIAVTYVHDERIVAAS